jgi:hypothetical protein
MDSVDATTPAETTTSEYLVPSLLTNSLRAVFEAFGADIIQLRARGSLETTNATALDDLREYAVSWHQQDQQKITIDYEQLYQSGEPANLLTERARTQILDEVDARLAPHETSVDPDLAVTEMTVRITDDRLQQITPARSSEFDLTFVSDDAEDSVREPTKRRNADRSLYSELGFKIRNLNLHSVVETETKFHNQSDGEYLRWRGPEDTRPRTPKRLAVRINEHVLPDAYGVLKPYIVADDEVLELSDGINDSLDRYPTTDSMDGDR